MADERKNLFLDTGVLAHLEARCEVRGRGPSFSTSANEGLGRYFALLEKTRRQLQSRLTPAELAVCADSLKGVLIDPRSLPYALEEAVEMADELGPKWGVEATALRAKIKALSLLEIATVVDAVERYFLDVEQDKERDILRILDFPVLEV